MIPLASKLNVTMQLISRSNPTERMRLAVDLAGAGTGADTATTLGVQLTQAVTPFRLTFSKYP
jgi:hypothetical protein